MKSEGVLCLYFTSLLGLCLRGGRWATSSAPWMKSFLNSQIQCSSFKVLVRTPMGIPDYDYNFHETRSIRLGLEP